MIRRPLVMLMVVSALVLGFFFGYTFAKLDDDFSKLLEPIRKVQLPDGLKKRLPIPRPGPKAGSPEPTEEEPSSESAATEEPEATPGALERVKLVRIVDGDTLHMIYRGQDETVRLLRVNTPERGLRGYAESTEALRALVEEGRLSLEFEEPGKLDRDNYGRVLAYLRADGEIVNVALVRLGWSRFWTDYGEGRFAEAFRSAEKEARAEKRGIWAFEEKKPTPTPKRTVRRKPVAAPK